MTFTAKVHNGAIELPEGVSLPEGIEVQVIAEAHIADLEARRGNNLVWLNEFAGVMEGPADFAAEHDHYIHGTPKREER